MTWMHADRQTYRQTDVHTSIHLYIHHRYLCIGPAMVFHAMNSQVQSPLVKDDRWWRASSVPRLKLAQHFHCWEPQSPALSYWAGNGWDWIGMDGNGIIFHSYGLDHSPFPTKHQ